MPSARGAIHLFYDQTSVWAKDLVMFDAIAIVRFQLQLYAQCIRFYASFTIN